MVPVAREESVAYPTVTWQHPALQAVDATLRDLDTIADGRSALELSGGERDRWFAAQLVLVRLLGECLRDPEARREMVAKDGTLVLMAAEACAVRYAGEGADVRAGAQRTLYHNRAGLLRAIREGDDDAIAALAVADDGGVS